AVIVVRTEVELVGGGGEGPHITGGIGHREALAAVIHEKAAGKGGRGAAAGKAVPRIERARAEIAASLQHGGFVLVVEAEGRVALAAQEVAPQEETDVLDIAIAPDVA